MQIITLYRYIREDGGVTVSPNKPDTEYTILLRLVADDGKALTQDGDTLVLCVDTDTQEGWSEVDAPEEVFDVHSENWE